MHAVRFVARLWLWRRAMLAAALAGTAVVLIAAGRPVSGAVVAGIAVAYVLAAAVTAAIQRK